MLSPKTLSVCCLTDDTTPRTAAILSLLRPVAGEIVVAVDSRAPFNALRTYGGLADRVLRYEYAPPLPRAFAWLHAQCSGDWILQIASDEVPSASLLDALPDLIQARDVHQFPMPRRWLFGDTHHWLDEAPWWPDYSFRLVRNDPATLWFPGVQHAGLYPARPARYVEFPLYHLDCLLRDYEGRAAKVALYGQVPSAAGAIADSIFYLPEDHATLPSAVVPAEDAVLIESVVAAGDGKGHDTLDGAMDVPVAGRREIDAYWDERQVSEDAYKATLRLIERDRRMRVGERRVFYFRVHNQGPETWPFGPLRHPEITVCYCWLRPDGTVAVNEGLHSPLTAYLRPDTSDVVPATLDAPDVPGRYVLEADLVHNRSRWFGVVTRESFTVDPDP